MMKTLFIDCGMGVAGDMLTAALLELHPDKEDFIRRFHLVGIPGVEMKAETSVKCGIRGTHVRMIVNGVEEESLDAHDHEHAHTSVRNVNARIDALSLPDDVKADVRAVYRLIAEAESSVHGEEVTEIHFHEVGDLDALADITAVCMLLFDLKPDTIIASPVTTGYGAVRCTHGILPVPAPATALLLKNIPARTGDIESELCTPTGAALLKHFVHRFEQMPLLCTERIGYGMGKKEFHRLNAVRVLFGETEDPKDSVVEFFCNVDDMTGEEAGYAVQKLFDAGALEVFTTPVFMKKNRPGLLFSIMCRREARQEVLEAVFRYTTTIGVRETVTERHVLERETISVETPYGTVRKKMSTGFGVVREKPEFEDLARIAEEQDLTLDEVRRLCR